MTVTSLELAKVAAIAADSKKAHDIVLIDLTGSSDVCDYFLICSGNNGPMVDSIVDEIREKIRANCGLSPYSCEGRRGLSWVLLDYGSLVVHVFKPETRDYYRLERLWGDAPRVQLDLEGMADESAYLGDDDELPTFELDPDDLEDNVEE